MGVGLMHMGVHESNTHVVPRTTGAEGGES